MPASEHRATEQKKLAGIFISYRRTDNPDATGRIYDRLVSEFGKARVFKDVDSIPLGQDFRGHLNGIVGDCAAVLAIIGPKWTDTRNAGGTRRLEDPDDFVRIELESALARDIPVVPVLVGHAPMPGSKELPGSLSSMAYRQSIEVRPDPDFHNDATRLVSALKAIVDPHGSHQLPGDVSGKAAKPPASDGAPGHWRRFVWVIALAGLLIPLLATFGTSVFRQLRAPLPQEIRTEISAHAKVVDAGAIALSPDGSQIVFVETSNGASHLMLRALAATGAQMLPGTEGGTAPFWSPDSRSIGFFTSDALKRLDVGGGAPLTLAPISVGMGGSWNADDVILFSQAGKGLGTVAATGGAVKPLTQFDQKALVYPNPVFLPDGRRFLFLLVGGKAPGTYLGSLDGSSPVRLTEATGHFAYLPSGWLLMWDGTRQGLFAQRLDADKAALEGSLVTLAVGSGAVSASATGLIAYWPSAADGGKRQLRWLSRSGAELGAIGEPDETYLSPSVSPEGRRVAVSRSANGKQDIWLLEGVQASRVTFDGAGNSTPLWSLDGTRIVFYSWRTDAHGLYQISADGAGEAQLLLGFDYIAAPSSWSSNGRFLMYVHLGASTLLDLGVLPMTGDRTPWEFLKTPFQEGQAAFSPDGKWVAYQSDESNQPQVFIRPFAAPDAKGNETQHSGKRQVSNAGGANPKWSPDGKELYFLDPSGDMMAVPISLVGSALASGAPVKLFQSHIVGSVTNSYQGPQYDVARDGRFLVNTLVDAETPVPTPIILIQNWNPNSAK